MPLSNHQHRGRFSSADRGVGRRGCSFLLFGLVLFSSALLINPSNAVFKVYIIKEVTI